MGNAPVIEPVNGRQDRKEFLDLPARLYDSDPCWVPPLRSAVREMITPGRHPFHEHAEIEHFLARDGSGRVIGRVSAIVNHAHNRYHSDRTGFFGFLEATRDPSVFAGLLDTAADWLGERGMDRIRGPISFSTNEEVGMLVAGFDGSPVVMMPYNPEWYPSMMRDCGFTKAVDLFAYRVDREEMRRERFSRIAGLIGKRYGASVRPMDMRNFHSELDIIRRIYNECWKDNWGFIPMSDNEFKKMSGELKLLLRPELAPIVEVGDGEPVAFAAAVMDANQALIRAGGSLLGAILRLKVPPFRVRIDGLRVLLLGVRDSHRGRGLESMLIDQIISSGVRMGHTWAELSWVLENNVPMRRILEKDLGAVAYRTYRVYDREIAPAGSSPTLPGDDVS